MEIMKEIFQVGGGPYTTGEDAAVYLIHFKEEAALVDAGSGYASDRMLSNIETCGVSPHQIRYILLTHCHFDHTGGVCKLRDRLDCEVVAHEQDAVFLEEGNDTVTAAKWYGSRLEPFTVDRKLSGEREEFFLGDRALQAIHVPGHSPGSVVYLAESEGLRVLFGQDVHGPLDPGLLSNRKDYEESLRKLIALQPDILCEGHYGVFRGKAPCRDFIASFL